jgi:hypothetical protein
MKTILFKCTLTLLIILAIPLASTSIETSNRILTTIGNTSITVLDVKKEMDRQIFMNDKTLFNDVEKHFAFYYHNWKKTLQKMAQDEVLLLESKRMKYELPSFEINKKVTELFGDKEVEAYKFLSISPEQARAIGERELISNHLSWFQIWSKSYLEATPSAILQAYENHIQTLAKKDSWTYQALYVRGQDKDKVEEVTSSISNLLSSGSFFNLASIIDNIHFDENLVKVQVSKDITLKANEISSSVLTVLESLEDGMVSKMILGKDARNFTGKILQLKEHKKEPIPRLADISETLKNQIVNMEGEKLASSYFTKLFKQYDADGLYGATLNSSTLEPFVLSDD